MSLPGLNGTIHKLVALVLVLVSAAASDTQTWQRPDDLRLDGLHPNSTVRAWATDALPVCELGHAAQTASQLAEHISEGSAALREVASQLAQQRASLQHSAQQAFAHLSEQSTLWAQASREQAVKGMTEIASQLAEQQAAFILAAGQAAAMLAQREAEMHRSAGQAAAQLAERLSEGPQVLKAAVVRLGEQRETVQSMAAVAMTQLETWRTQAQSAASQSAAQLAESVAQKKAELAETMAQRKAELAEKARSAASQSTAHFAESLAQMKAELVEAGSRAAGRLADRQSALRSAAAAVGAHLSEQQAAVAQTAIRTLEYSGQETLLQASGMAAALLYEHEKLLRQSSTLIVGLADMQATFSPTAARIAAQLAELERHVAANDGSRCSLNTSTDASVPQPPAVEFKPFAYAWLLAVKARLQGMGVELPVAISLLAIVMVCACVTLSTVMRGGGEDPVSLGYSSLLLRAGCWLIQRVCCGWAFVLLSDRLAEAPFNIPKYDVMGWPLWSTAIPAATQLLFFCPAALVLNTAVAHRSRARYSTPKTRCFYASLSREVHAAIIGCFVSDWLLFPTDLTFLVHHLFGLFIVLGIWSMVLKEARSLGVGATEPRTPISFWWVTGLSIATMEGSSFFYCLYSLMSFGEILKLSLFAAYTYSHVLSITCVISQHPWGTSMKAIWWAGSWAGSLNSSQSAMPQLPLLKRLRSKKGACVSVNYLYISLMVIALCMARQHMAWDTVKGQTSGVATILVGNVCALLAAGCAWRLRDFKE